MLIDCFEHVDREPNPYTQFAVIDVNQIDDLSIDAIDELQHMLLVARFEPKFLADLASELGWEVVSKKIVSEGVAKTGPVSRGDFGEALLGHFLEELHAYIVPVKKLRFKISAGQTLPGTDILALQLNPDGEIVEVCYVESKLRTTRDNAVAVEGYEQLKADFLERLPDILTFAAARLHDRTDPLYPAFRDYLKSRLDTKEIDSFRLGLCWDSERWRERALENLEDNGVELPILIVHVLRVNELRLVSDEILSAVGAISIIEDA